MKADWTNRWTRGRKVSRIYTLGYNQLYSLMASWHYKNWDCFWDISNTNVKSMLLLCKILFYLWTKKFDYLLKLRNYNIIQNLYPLWSFSTSFLSFIYSFANVHCICFIFFAFAALPQSFMFTKAFALQQAYQLLFFLLLPLLCDRTYTTQISQ